MTVDAHEIIAQLQADPALDDRLDRLDGRMTGMEARMTGFEERLPRS